MSTLQQYYVDSSLVNPFGYYEDVVHELSMLTNFQICSLNDMAGRTETPEYGLCGLRHDIDMDMVTGVRCARHLARYGIPGSFYPLHTAHYYGSWEGDHFVRSDAIGKYIVDLIVTGCEIGLHIDPWEVAYSHSRDGGREVAEEIAWLRSFGIPLKGVVGHNSFPPYCAENFEIFKELVLWDREVTKAGVTLRLGQLSMGDLGLAYEGTFARPRTDPDIAATEAFAKMPGGVLDERWMRMFLHDNPYAEYATDWQAWLVGNDFWILSITAEAHKGFFFNIGLTELLRRLDALPTGMRGVAVIHPCYVAGE